MMIERHAENKIGKAAPKSWRFRILEGGVRSRETRSTLSRGAALKIGIRAAAAEIAGATAPSTARKLVTPIAQSTSSDVGSDAADFHADEDDTHASDNDDEDDVRDPQLRRPRTDETTPLKDPRRHHLRQFLHLFVIPPKQDRKTTTLTLNKRKEPLNKKIRRYLKEGRIFPHLNWCFLSLPPFFHRFPPKGPVLAPYASAS